MAGLTYDSSSANTGRSGGSTDVDGDGLLDGFDNDIDRLNYDPTNGGLNADSHPDFQGVTTERDWREDVTLPVEWLAFDAILRGNDALLTWATATELNSKYFQIERSGDGVLFESVGTVSASGTTSRRADYTFTDPRVTAAGTPSLLYRIRQVDVDGAFQFSKVQEINLDGPEETLTISVYPNPSSEKVTIDIGYVGQSQLRVMNTNGQVVYSLSLDESSNSERLVLPINGWASGIYYVQLFSKKRQTSTQLIIP